MPAKKTTPKKKTTDKNGFSTHLVVVLKEMCRRVKAKYADIDFKANEWYRKHRWSRDEEHAFEEWLANYLYTTAEARRELLEFSSYSNKKRCLKAAQEFTFMYGWVLSD